MLSRNMFAQEIGGLEQLGAGLASELVIVLLLDVWVRDPGKLTESGARK